MGYGLLSALGAFLLFFLQPFIGKVVTPWFGGSAHVWILCMVFFQALLVAGYAYAHLLATRLSLRLQLGVHGAVLLSALGAMAWTWRLSGHPMVPPPSWAPPGGEPMLGTTLGLLARSVGLPYFALSATAPLVQAWAARRPEAAPYRLYALSNAGSLAGLLAFPLLAEPLLDQGGQARLIFAGLAIFAALLVWVGRQPETGAPAEAEAPADSPFRLIWMVAPAIGSGLLVAGTSLLTEGVVTIPLLWTLPLAVYLGTYILWFDASWLKEGPLSFGLLGGAFTLALLALPWALGQPAPAWPVFAVLAVVGTGCLLAHGLAYAVRPPTRRLTAYYLSLSAGGALGGLAAGIGAPRLFDRVYEFPIAVACCGLAALLWLRERRWPRRNVLAVAGLLPLLLGFSGLLREARRPGRFFRDDYAVVNVGEVAGVKVLVHANVVHGLELEADPERPLTYFGPASGVGRAFALARQRKARLRVGVLGLGLGSVAGYGRAGDTFRFYELSPMVASLSTGPDPAFEVLRECPARTDVRVGDGRLLLEQEPAAGPAPYDLLLVDAFNGGQVPWHLLTREAFLTYLGRLAPGGILVLHVSNRLPLDRLVAAQAKALGLWAMGIDQPSRDNPVALGPLDKRNNFVLLAPDTSLAVDELVRLSSWIYVPPALGIRVGPKSLPKARRGEAIAASLRPWTDRRNSLAELLWAGRPAYAEAGVP